MKNPFYSLEVRDDLTLVYHTENKEYKLRGPAFEIDGKLCKSIRGARFAEERQCGKYWTESKYVANLEGCTLELLLRTCPHTPFVRYRFTLFSEKGEMTKALGRDNLVYTRFACKNFRGTEVRLSENNHQLYSFCLSETPAFLDEDSIMGPILVQERGRSTSLLAYEHGSQYPDKFLCFTRANGEIRLEAVKGNYYSGRKIPADDPYETVWLQFGATDGDTNKLAALYREFQLNWILPGHPSREPLIYYNTWNEQERTQLKTGSYHNCMSLEHILRDIDIAHRMGIDVFVLDTGWFTRCGDWEVRTDRFPDGLDTVSEKLRSYGMKLGLWINPTAVALSSPLIEEDRDCIATYLDKLTGTFEVWESGSCHGMCLASRYWKVLADTLIRLCKSKGVSYIKWDAIWQYGCTDAHHLHGTENNSLQERGECYSFEMDRCLSRICDAILGECPDTILDFDITEEGRNVGLSWLSRGKYFLVNNGPNYHNYDLPDPQWTNIFVNPGPARTWICRAANNYDRWIPAHLFLCHYFPDPPHSSQRMNLGSLILGGSGIWGVLQSLSEEDVQLHADILGDYKQVAPYMAKAAAVQTGTTATTLQKFEKIDPETGKGAVVLFGFCTRKNKVVTKISVPCSGNFAVYGNATVTQKNGSYVVEAEFDGADAVIVFCK